MKRIIPLLLACALLVSCGAPATQPSGTASTPGHTSLSRLALKEPVYPAFPTPPQVPEGDDWDTYFRQEQAYYDAISALRGDGIDEETAALILDFATRTTAQAMRGHEGENTVYSPLSLWTAMSLLAQCAQGDSRQQVLDALGSNSIDTLSGRVSRLWKGLYTDDGTNSLLLANSVWLNNDREGHYVQETLDTLAEDYFAGTYSVPMGHSAADTAVTDWVSEQTGGLIGGDEPVVKTRQDTLALLVSSLYYRAGWRDEFSPDLTVRDTFTAADGSEATADFMHKNEDGHFLLGESWQAAALSTHLGEMVFVLPNEGVTPESLLADPDFLSGLDLSASNSHYGEVQWSVPKFDADSSLDLLGTLKALGITDLLDPNKSDLSALSDLDACLSEAKQLARVKVDEEGVEAAAVTILTVTECAAMMGTEEVCVMDLDHPFLFLIRTAGVPLFVGVVNEI